MADNAKPNYEKLEWGHGPRILDVFLEPTCPFCTLAFGKLKPLLDQAGEDRITIRIHMHSQPWHLFSGVVVRAILAASAMPGGKQAAWDVMVKIFENRDDFICIDHNSGPNMDASPAEILQRIHALTGLDLRPAFERKEVTDVMKWHARFARQNGIHMSPTFIVDGLVNDKMSSGDEVGKWMADLGLHAIDA
jgi:predicted DsbA family dithiol-disulfide isomerase